VKRVVFAVPGDLATPTGGYAYDRSIIAELRNLGWDVEVVNIGSDFPRPSARTLEQAGARLAHVSADTPIVVDGLAFGAMPELAAELARAHALIALVHHPLALETGLAASEADRLRESERAALASASGVVVTSPSTARLLAADYGIAPKDITVVLPGNEPRAPARGSSDGTIALLAVGSLVPRKGYDVLIAALGGLRDLAWRLTIAGDPGRDPATSRQLEKAIRRLDLADRINVVGAVSDQRLAELYAEADLFVLASRFEGYGIAFAEAIAHGLPVVGTTGGAVPDTVPAEAGLLVRPDDAEALACALRQVIAHPQERRRLAAGARATAARLPTWRQSGAQFAQAIEAAR
jgi:glycosyltransferase involved in cell wall biosynthesis